MTQEHRHFILKGYGKGQDFRSPKGGGPANKPEKVPDPQAHGRKLLGELDALPDCEAEGRPGLYLSIIGRADQPMVKDRLRNKNLSLLNIHKNDTSKIITATLYSTPEGVEDLKKKISDFAGPERTEKGHRKNADLAQSIDHIHEADMRALWRGPESKYPSGEGKHFWELWLSREKGEDFIEHARKQGFSIGHETLEFHEDLVVIAEATTQELAELIKKHEGLKALAATATTGEFFLDLPIEEQTDWVENLQHRLTSAPDCTSYVTLLDTGIALTHPLLNPYIHPGDRHAAYPQWDVTDHEGHGSELAGLVLYGDLGPVLQSSGPVFVRHRLESAKVIPDKGENPHHLLGFVTRQAINAVEVTQRRRVFCMATTTKDDSPHDGAPTSWSTEMDQLGAGISGKEHHQRLILISAGNSDQDRRFTSSDYLPVCDRPDNELESPAQSWNPITVGAYTTKCTLPETIPGQVLAPMGDLSPHSRTASWDKHWPIKPDVVYEGGNLLLSSPPPAYPHDSLMLLTTSHNYPERAFSSTACTSAATALASREIAELWADYPDLWPETIRALFVASARWTEQMKSHLPPKPQKGDYARLFQRYGYGVPNLKRARRSASNALTLVIEDTITPYTAQNTLNELKLYTLPWPEHELRKLGTVPVTLRIALSTFIEPNPSEAARGNKYGYASHNLRFTLIKPDEDPEPFMERINKAAKPTGVPRDESDDGWEFGPKRRDVGSLQIDQITCQAYDLTKRHLLAVYPVQGWWKSAKHSEPPVARFALIVEINAPETQADLYSEVKQAIVKQAIDAKNRVPVEV